METQEKEVMPEYLEMAYLFINRSLISEMGHIDVVYENNGLSVFSKQSSRAYFNLELSEALRVLGYGSYCDYDLFRQKVFLRVFK